MASIRKVVEIAVPPAFAWDAVRDAGAAGSRLFPSVLAGVRLEGNERIVTFRNGRVIREAIVGCDDAAMRFAYAILGEHFRHDAAAFSVLGEGDTARIEWIVDVLPDEAAPAVASTMDRGLADMRSTLERAYRATPSVSS
jgi:Polyketide cyclase / dehydrase and lipid transport